MTDQDPEELELKARFVAELPELIRHAGAAWPRDQEAEPLTTIDRMDETGETVLLVLLVPSGEVWSLEFGSAWRFPRPFGGAPVTRYQNGRRMETALAARIPGSLN